MKGRKLWIGLFVFGTASVILIFKVLDIDISQETSRRISADNTLQEAYKLPRRNAPNRWMVISLENVDEVDVSYLDDVIDWHIVIVGPLPYIDGCRKPRCIYLHPGNIRGLNFRSLEHVDEEGYQMKNIAFLYAIQHSADVIYDLEYGVKPVSTTENFIYSDYTHGLIYTSNSTFNYYSHFGQPYLYPKGFPTQEKETQSKVYDLCYAKTPPIQQGLTSGHSPVYITQRYKLVQISKQDAPNIQFDNAAPPVFVPPGKLSVVTSGNTLFTRNAFWALLLPAGDTLFYSELIRGYVSQRLLWETGDSVGLMGVTGTQHSKIYDERESDRVIMDNANKFAEKLKSWKCDSHDSLYKCYEHLVSYIVYTDILPKGNIEIIQAWLYDIKALFPEAIRTGWNHASRDVYGQMCTKANFAPNIAHHIVYNLTSMSLYTIQPWNNRPFCPDVEEVRDALKTNKPPKYLFPDILLIVEINYSKLYGTISTVENIYRRHFPNILYCGPSTDDFLLYRHGVSHTEAVRDGWHYLYQCVNYAMKMNYRVKGYLHIGDDTLMNLWNIHSLPRESIWFNKNRNVYNRSIQLDPWAWWRLPEGRENMEKVFAELREISKSGLDKSALADQFFKTYVQNSKSLEFMYGSTCDFYYMPHKVKDGFLFLTTLLRKHNVIVELGIPTIIQGLDLIGHMELLPGKLIFGEQRGKIQELFTTEDYFMHPVKFGSMMKHEEGRLFYCERIQPLFEGSIEIRSKKQ